jgi:hypothetical protein
MLTVASQIAWPISAVGSSEDSNLDSHNFNLWNESGRPSLVRNRSSGPRRFIPMDCAGMCGRADHYPGRDVCGGPKVLKRAFCSSVKDE